VARMWTKAALAAAKVRRTKLGGRRWAKTLPTIAKIRPAGATTPRQIPAELNALEVLSAAEASDRRSRCCGY
jgi:hypothetical protein